MYRWLLVAFLMFALNSAVAAQNILTTPNTVLAESDDDCDGSCPLPEDGDETVASGCPGGDDDGDGDGGNCPHQSTVAEGCPGGGDDDGDGDGGDCPHHSPIAHGCGDDDCGGDDDDSGEDKK